MKTKKLICLSLLLAIGLTGLSKASWRAQTLKQQVENADVIVAGEIIDVKRRSFSITWYEDGSEGKKVRYASFYDVGILKPKTVLKGARKGLINKADKSNPVDWMYMAFDSKNQEEHPFRHSLLSYTTGQKGVWLLKRDKCMTYLHFVNKPHGLVADREDRRD